MAGTGLPTLGRRQLFAAAAIAGLGLTMTPVHSANLPPDPFMPVPLPPLPSFKEGVAEIPDARLYYRDFGGDGVPVVLMHPATGSALMWGYQVPALVKAGYRVIAYSRRGYYGSDPADKANGGHPSIDLLHLMDKLGIGKFAMVATAAGCTIALDFAMDHSGRLAGMVVSSGSYGNIAEPDYKRVNDAVITKGFNEMPPEFRELGPSYRAANFEGVKLWLELEHQALSGNRAGPTNANKFTWANFARIKAPTLFIAGAADLYAPPPMMRLVASHVPGAEMIVVPDSGHSVYWEQPDAFNQIAIDFLARVTDRNR
ncbi:MAG: alpha/beta hydrolase [Hyphomicrobiales bacterium]|nr:alpha/beta hydrolase [Hyphomicrobiales bacterium]